MLLLSTGYQHEWLRTTVVGAVKRLGFDCLAYDSGGYPVDAIAHSHVACLEAIPKFDIVVAFADETEGGRLQLSEIPDGLFTTLKQHDIVRDSPGAVPPTIFETEVLYAKRLDKPTLVFVPESVAARVHEVLTLLRRNALLLTPRHSSARAISDLIRAADLAGLADDYTVPVGEIASFHHLAFLERLRKESPNWVSYYSMDNWEEHVRGRLAAVPESIARHQPPDVLLRRRRDPLGDYSLFDLLNSSLILAPAYSVLSGPPASGPLFAPTGDDGWLPRTLRDSNSVLLLGEPGQGKSTTALITFRQLAITSRSGASDVIPLFVALRYMAQVPNDAAGWVRQALGALAGRRPWPPKLPLPGVRWCLILDGLDEALVDRDDLIENIRGLSHTWVILLTCRLQDYERRFEEVKHFADAIARLDEWEPTVAESYAMAAEKAGLGSGARLIRDAIRENVTFDFIATPLWLSMLLALGEARPSAALPNSGYELLKAASRAVANAELARRRLQPARGEAIVEAWRNVAWLIHSASHQGRLITEQKAFAAIGRPQDSPERSVIASALDVERDGTIAFRHQVLFEFWLAEFVIDLITMRSRDALLEALSFQRSLGTNRFIRDGLRARSEAAEATGEYLRTLFLETEGWINPRATFMRNQLLYLIGRIDDSHAAVPFLRMVWRDIEQPMFVRYSAAFAAARSLDKVVESEFWTVLQTEIEWDALNRGYHRYYYGDARGSEADMPILDARGPAEVTIKALLKRLASTDSQRLGLRRIDLYTLRRLLEVDASRQLPDSVTPDVVRSWSNNLQGIGLDPEFIVAAEAEARRLIDFAMRTPSD